MFIKIEVLKIEISNFLVFFLFVLDTPFLELFRIYITYAEP